MELVPLWRQIDLDSLPSTWKDEAPDAQDQEEDVGKERRHVNGFAGRLDALDEAGSHQKPGEEKGADRSEAWGALQTRKSFCDVLVFKMSRQNSTRGLLERT